MYVIPDSAEAFFFNHQEEFVKQYGAGHYVVCDAHKVLFDAPTANECMVWTRDNSSFEIAVVRPVDYDVTASYIQETHTLEDMVEEVGPAQTLHILHSMPDKNTTFHTA